MGLLPKCLKCKNKGKMVKFMCPNMDHHYKCMNCLQCYSMSMAKIDQPPRRIDETLPMDQADNKHDHGVVLSEEEAVVDEPKHVQEIELSHVEVDVTESDTEQHSIESHAELNQSGNEGVVEDENDEIEVIYFQDLLPRRDELTEESNCCQTKTDIESVLKQTNELLLMLATVLFYAGYAVPFQAQQVSPAFTNTINPLRRYRYSLWNAAHKNAHSHNVRHCMPHPDVIAHRIASLTVAVGAATEVHQKDKGRLQYSSFLPRNFNCIMSLEQVPQQCDKREFRHQTKYHLMDATTHQVYFNEQINVGTIYSLDTVFSIRLFLDTTFLAAGKTTQMGKFEISLRDLVARGACEMDVSGTFRLENAKYWADVELTFQFVTVEESEELQVLRDLHSSTEALKKKLAAALSSSTSEGGKVSDTSVDNEDTIRL